MNSTGKKITAKVAAVVAVSSSVFVLPAASAVTSAMPAVALAESQASPPDCNPSAQPYCYRDKIIPMVTQFFRAKYRAMAEPSNYYVILEHGQLRSKCQDPNGGYLGDGAYDYCSDDYSIYLGQVKMWQLYQDSYIAPIVALAHEWGHNVQTRKHVQEPGVNDHTRNVRYEEQADCIAGAWIQYADQQGWLEPGDGHDIDKFIKKVGSTESPDHDHGTPEERGAAMLKGSRGGLEACNDYYPETPIITSQD